MSLPRSEYISKILRDHHEWLQSNGERGVQLDLSGADLRKVNLSNTIMDEAMMAGASIQNAQMRGIDVRGSDLSFARADSRTKLLHAQLVRGQADPPGSRGEARMKDSFASADYLRKRREPGDKGR